MEDETYPTRAILRRFRVDEPVGREHDLQRLRNFVRRTDDSPHILPIIAEGGMGKSHLIQHIMNEILGETWTNKADRHPPVSDGSVIFVDLDIQWGAIHTVLGLMSTMMDDLRKFVGDDPLTPYNEAVISYIQVVQDQSNRRLVDDRFKRITTQFQACLHELAERYRIAVFIDTMEEFERLEENWKTIRLATSEERDSFVLKDVRNFLCNTLFEIENIRYIVTGRDREVSPLSIYEWYQPDFGLLPVAHLDPEPIRLLALREEEAEQLLQSQGIDLSQDTPEIRTIKQQLENLKGWEQAVHNPRIGYKPIFILMLAEVFLQGKLKLTSEREELEAQLVQQYWRVTPENIVLLRMALGKKTYLFDAELISMQIGFDIDNASGIIQKLRKNPFVRAHREGVISLQDEFRRLLVKYVWYPRFQSLPSGEEQVDQADNERRLREERAVLTKTLAYYIKKHQHVEQRIFDLIGDLKHVASPWYAVGSTIVTKETAKALNQLLEWFRFEQEEENYIREMQILISTIGYYNNIQYIDDRMKVFDIYWKSLRSYTGDSDKRREQQITSMANAFRRFMNQGQLPDDSNDPEAYWHDLLQHYSLWESGSQLGLEKEHWHRFLYHCIDFRRNHIQHKYHYQNKYREGWYAYQEILDKFKKLLDYRDYSASEPERIERAKLTVGIMVKQAIEAIYDAKPNWVEIDRQLQEAYQITLSFDQLHEAQSDVLRQLGWSARRQWKIEEAIKYYDENLRQLGSTRTGNRSLAVYSDLATVLNNSAYATRYVNAHVALVRGNVAFGMHQQMRRHVYVIREARPLSVIHRLLGNHEKALEKAQIAVRLADKDNLNSPDQYYISLIQYLQTVCYTGLASRNPAIRSKYLGDEQTRAIHKLFKQFYKHEAEPYPDWQVDENDEPATRGGGARKAIDNSYLLGELVQFYFMYVEFALREDPDFALEVVDHCFFLIRYYLTDDRYRTLLAYRTRLLIYSRNEQYNYGYERFIASHEYTQSREIVRELQKVGFIALAQIDEVAGKLALDEALKYEQNPRFKQAIDHYIDAYFLYASQTGYNVVMLLSAFDNIHDAFTTLRRFVNSKGHDYYQNILDFWCDRFAEALLHPEHSVPDVLDVTEKETAHERQYFQGHHFIRAQRLLNWFAVRELTADDLHRDTPPTDEDFDAIEAVLTNSQDGNHEALLYSLMVALPRQASQAQRDSLWRIYRQYAGQTQDLMTHIPKTWSFGQIEWNLFLVMLCYVEAGFRNLSYAELSIFTAVVENVHFVSRYGAYAKLYLAEVFDSHGYTNAAEGLLQQALDQFFAVGEVAMVIDVANRLSRILALHGDYLSSRFYANALEEIEPTVPDIAVRQDIRVTVASCYRSWGGLAAKRGAPRTIEELFLNSIDALQKADELSPELPPERQYEIRLEKLRTYGYWLEDSMELEQDPTSQPSYEKFIQDFIPLYDELSLARNDVRVDRMLSYIHVKSPHVLARLRGERFEDVQEIYRQRALENLEDAQTHLASDHDLLGILSRKLELRYIGDLTRPNPQLLRQRPVQHETIYQDLLNDPDYRDMIRLREDFEADVRAAHARHLQIKPRLLTFSHRNPFLPEAFNHYFGRVELIAGWVAQQERYYPEAVQHYRQGGDLIAHSVYSLFFVNLLLKFLEERFLDLIEFEVPGRRQIQTEWADFLLEGWEPDYEFKYFYPDLLEFVRVQRILANLSV